MGEPTYHVVLLLSADSVDKLVILAISGGFVALASKCHPETRIFFFEPDAATALLLRVTCWFVSPYRRKVVIYTMHRDNCSAQGDLIFFC